jgi:DNA repair protein RecO (recombination protein O)
VEWQDEGVVLVARRHGETAAVATLLTREHGRHAGLVRGGAGRKARPIWQTGNRLRVTWRARLPEHLGAYGAEPIRLYAAEVFDDPARLAGLSSACALIDARLPERDPHPALHDALVDLLDALATRPDWAARYVRFELALLAELGFGLDLSACAATGATTDLAYVSPKSGRAVSRAGAGAFADRLLPLPAFLLGQEPADGAAVLEGLRLTGYFLRRHMFEADERPVPGARERLLSLLGRRSSQH